MEHEPGSGNDQGPVSSAAANQPPPRVPAEHAGTPCAGGQAEMPDAGKLAAAAQGSDRDRAKPGAERPVTGEPRVDAALRGLGELDELPVSEHPGVYEGIHGQLVEVLGELRSGPADPAAR